MLKILFGLLFSYGLAASQHVFASQCQFELQNFNDCLKSHGESDCNRNLITAYSEILYVELNNSLRGVKPDPVCNEVAEKLNVALRKLPMVKEHVYRGSKLTPELQKMMRDYHKDSCFTDLAFMSTSRSLDIAKNFAESVILKLYTTSGRDIDSISDHEGEREILIPPHTWFKLIKMPTMIDQETFFEFTEVSGSDCYDKQFFLPVVQPVRIIVNKATYGGNQSPDREGNATGDVGNLCNDKNVCSYSVSTESAKDAYEDVNKSFSLSWSCKKGNTIVGPFTRQLSAPAVSANFEFGCSPDNTEMFHLKERTSDATYAELISVVTNKNENITALVNEKINSLSTDKAISFTNNELPKVSSMIVTYNCVTNEVSKLNMLKIKKHNGFFSGDLNCPR
jgi:hypothetical protein